MDNIVSCNGLGCNICGLFAVANNLFNYVLILSFAVAVLVLVAAGFSYLLSSGDSDRLEKSRRFVRVGMMGFVIILVGWAVINTLFLVSGYKDRGHWWKFDCTVVEEPVVSDEIAQNSASSQKVKVPGSPDEEVPVFSSLKELLDRRVPKGRVLGPDSAVALQEQLKGLPEGGTLKFLAPVRIGTDGTSQDYYLPLLTLKNMWGNIQLESTGEALNLIGEKVNGMADRPDQGFGMINSKGEALSGGELSLINPLFFEMKGTLFSRSASQSDEDIDTFITEGVSLLQGENNYAEIKNYLARLVALVMKMLSGMLVEADYGNGSTLKALQRPANDNQDTGNTSGGYDPARWKETNANKDTTDSDGDGIPDWQDACVYTFSDSLGDVNRDPKAAGLYGCSCEDIGNTIGMGCPPDMCVGNYWQTYPTGVRNCVQARLQPYACPALTSTFTSDCPQLTEKATTTETDQNDDRGIPWGEGDDGYSDAPAQTDSPDSVKKALRLIAKYDPLRYEMIFRYVDRIIGIRDPNMVNENTTTTGFTYDGGGAIYVNMTLPVAYLAETIVHESTHAAHMYLYSDTDSQTEAFTNLTERLANANTIGSICRKSDSKDMSEFPEQSQKLIYQGKPVRGFISRELQKTNPQSGYLGTAAYYDIIRYASDFGNLTQGPYHYGDDQAGMVLGLAGGEEKVMQQIVENKEECLSKPTADLPPVPACDYTDREIMIGGWDWYEY